MSVGHLDRESKAGMDMYVRNVMAAAGFIAGLGALGSTAQADTQVYFNDFQNGAASGFSGSNSVLLAPNNSELFLGPLTQGASTTLTLNNVAAHTAVSLSFSLYAIRSLDGNGGNGSGVDPFSVSFGGFPIFFQNFSNYGNGETQGYPNLGTNAPGTGSSATNTLGYTFSQSLFGDSTYTLNLTDLPNSSSTFSFVFTGLSDQGTSDEFYGIDNVRVGITPTATVPVPGPLAGAGIVPLLGFGLMAMRRRKQRLAA